MAPKRTGIIDIFSRETNIKNEMSESFSVDQFDEDRAAAYDDRIRRIAPGYDVLHEVLSSMLETKLGPEAHLLIVGAGTGTEIINMGRAQPDWHFTAVDPSADMLTHCRQRMSEAGLDGRVDYVCERVEDLSVDRLFDGATAVFVSHFLQDRAAKQRFFGAIARRVQPRGPFVFADLYRSGSDTDVRRRWKAWQTHFSRTGVSPEEHERTFANIERDISFVDEEDLDAVVSDAGFASITRLFQSFLWGAWGTTRIADAADGG